MKNIIKMITVVFVIMTLYSCNENNDINENNSKAPDSRIRTAVFAIDTSSDAYKLFLDKDGKIKNNISVLVGEHKFLLDKIMEIKSNQSVDFKVLSKFEGKNRSFTRFYSTKGNEHSAILNYVVEETRNPFYITIDEEKKFEIIVPKRPTVYANGDVKENAVTVNGKESKLLISDKAIIILK